MYVKAKGNKPPQFINIAPLQKVMTKQLGKRNDSRCLELSAGFVLGIILAAQIILLEACKLPVLPINTCTHMIPHFLGFLQRGVSVCLHKDKEIGDKLLVQNFRKFVT